MTQFILERDKAFFEAYRKAWDDGATTHAEAVDAALDSPTTRLWVSESYLRAVIDNMYRNRHHRHGARNGIYCDIYRSYVALRSSPLLRRRSTSYILRYLIYRPTQGFPLSVKTANRIIRRVRRLRSAARPHL